MKYRCEDWKFTLFYARYKYYQPPINGWAITSKRKGNILGSKGRFLQKSFDKCVTVNVIQKGWSHLAWPPAFIWSELQGVVASATLFRRHCQRFTTSPRAYTQAHARLIRARRVLIHTVFMSKLLTETRQMVWRVRPGLQSMHIWCARIHKQILAIVWNRMPPFTHLCCGHLSASWCHHWGPVCSDLEEIQAFLAADGTQLAMRQFSKSTSSWSCTPWPVHILTRVKDIDNQNAFEILFTWKHNYYIYNIRWHNSHVGAPSIFTSTIPTAV